jgi:hypothetical protein
LQFAVENLEKHHWKRMRTPGSRRSGEHREYIRRGPPFFAVVIFGSPSPIPVSFIGRIYLLYTEKRD